MHTIYEILPDGSQRPLAYVVSGYEVIFHAQPEYKDVRSIPGCIVTSITPISLWDVVAANLSSTNIFSDHALVRRLKQHGGWLDDSDWPFVTSKPTWLEKPTLWDRLVEVFRPGRRDA